MQRKLGRLAHGSDKKADADNSNQHPAGAGHRQFGEFVGLGKGFTIVECTGIGGNQCDSQNEAKVTNPVD